MHNLSEQRSADRRTFGGAIKLGIVSLGLLVTACANTIRGVGQDAANTVNATQSAGQKVENAAK